MSRPAGRSSSPGLSSSAGLSILLVLAAGLAASFIVHAPTLEYGFVYDDYGFVRPHTGDEVLASFSGPWDPLGPNVAFFRPLSVAFHALRFDWLQFDPWAYHVLSLSLFGIAAGLLGAALLRMTGSAPVALLGVAFTTVHPHMPYAATAWITNQMHECQLVVFAASLLWWSFCCTKSWVWWTPLLVAQLVAFLIKEDGVMLAPTIVAAHLLWTRTERGRLALPPWPYLALVVLIAGATLSWRHLALGGLGGYRPPDWDVARANLWRGYSRTLALLPIDRPGKLAAAVFVVGVSVLGGVAALRLRGRVRFLFGLGLAIVTICNLPYALVTKREQWHLLSLGGAVLVTGATWALWQTLYRPVLRIAFAVLTIGAVLSMGWVSRQMSADFAPFSPYVLETDRIVTDWAIVAPEVRAFIREKTSADGPTRGRFTLPGALQVVSYGIHGGEAEAREAGWRWTSSHVTFFVHPRARAIRMALGAVALPSLPDGPRSVTVTVNNSAPRLVQLPLNAWTDLDVPLPPASSARRLHRVDMRFEGTVVPARVDPSSQDTRELAARLGPITLVW